MIAGGAVYWHSRSSPASPWTSLGDTAAAFVRIAAAREPRGAMGNTELAEVPSAAVAVGEAASASAALTGAVAAQKGGALMGGVLSGAALTKATGEYRGDGSPSA